jgi:hypothetical protein
MQKLQRLKTYDQYKSLHSEELKTKTDDLMPQHSKKGAASTFTADEMDGISVVGNVVRLPTPPHKSDEDN